MKRIGNDVERLVARLAGDDAQARVNLRARQVRARYKAVLESVYRESAAVFLAHTNNVYIMRKKDVPTLIVYVDDSIFAAELNAQRELIKLKLLELFGEAVEEFEILVSRGAYKDNRPYLEDQAETEASPEPLAPLSGSEETYISAIASTVEDERVRKSFEKAMTADMARRKTENGKTS